MRKRTWLERRKKTDAELPYQPPVWLGDWSNGELYHRQTEIERKARELVLKQGDDLSRYYGMDRREFMASGLGMALTMSALNLVQGCSSEKDGGFFPDAGGDGGTGAGDGDGMIDPGACERRLDHSDMFIFDIQTHRVARANAVYRTFLSILPQGACGKSL